MESNFLLQSVKDLELPPGEYALFGSAPMCVRELRECKDIDIVVSAKIWEEYVKRTDWELEQASSGSACLRKGNFEMFKDWKPGEWEVTELIKEAETIHGLPFVALEKTLAWKKIMGREKDFEDIKIIEKFLEENKKNY